ncbi:MAG TPA: hypothetical protein VLT33_24440, partial [Labilithrix sp.]|nr:hypothetical protein [Labilithrix sp.]
MGRFRFCGRVALVVAAVVVSALVVSALGCNRQPLGASAAGSDASPSVSSSPATGASEGGAALAVDAAVVAASPRIGQAGGVVEGGGARLTIPRGALASERAFSLRRVTGAELADWPKGTQAGFLFTPAEERFRVPATIELPHEAGEGEVICQTSPTDRIVLVFEVTAKLKLFPVHVIELPQRCAVYTPGHAEAFKAAKVRAGEQVDTSNESFKWDIKGTVCDPRELVRPNAGKDFREPPGIGGCPAGMAPIPGKAGA